MALITIRPCSVFFLLMVIVHLPREIVSQGPRILLFAVSPVLRKGAGTHGYLCDALNEKNKRAKAGWVTAGVGSGWGRLEAQSLEDS